MSEQGTSGSSFRAAMRCLVVPLLLLGNVHGQVALLGGTSEATRPTVVREVVRTADYAQVDPGLWPRKVPVRQGDPMTGSAQVLEIWSYSAEFARRFEGFDEKLADPAMPAGTFAVVQRIYKADYRRRPTPPVAFNDHVCMTEIFFDSRTPVTETRTDDKDFRPGLRNFIALDNLAAKEPGDAATLRAAQRRPAGALQLDALMFTDGPARDIAGTMGILEYRPTIVPGISWMEGGPANAFDGCNYFYPRPKDSLMVLAMADYDPNENPRRRRRDLPRDPFVNQYLPLNHDFWKWQPAHIERGIIALPAGFTQRATEISVWMRDQSWCLSFERQRLRKAPGDTDDDFQKFLVRIKNQCADLREKGQINFHFANTPNTTMQRFEVIPGVTLSNPRR